MFTLCSQMLNLHGNPRDYAWGEGGLDAIITQVRNNITDLYHDVSILGLVPQIE